MHTYLLRNESIVRSVAHLANAKSEEQDTRMMSWSPPREHSAGYSLIDWTFHQVLPNHHGSLEREVDNLTRAECRKKRVGKTEAKQNKDKYNGCSESSLSAESDNSSTLDEYSGDVDESTVMEVPP